MYHPRLFCYSYFLTTPKVEEEAPILLRKAWQGEKIVDFPGGQDRQTAGVGGHAQGTFSECKKCTFSRHVLRALHCTGRLVFSAETIAENKM
jgi:hypothetical protein